MVYAAPRASDVRTCHLAYTVLAGEAVVSDVFLIGRTFFTFLSPVHARSLPQYLRFRCPAPGATLPVSQIQHLMPGGILDFHFFRRP